MYDYLWHGRGTAESWEVREAYAWERFAAMLDIGGIEVDGLARPFYRLRRRKTGPIGGVRNWNGRAALTGLWPPRPKFRSNSYVSL